MKKLLLHSCCAPCTTAVFDWLSLNGFEATSCFYNPNIRPIKEHNQRLSSMQYYATIKGLKVIYPSIIEEDRPTANDCESCYKVRLKKTAQTAKDNKYRSFSTTLLISPFQKHDLLKEIGLKLAEEIGIEFFYQDFRSEFKRSQQMAKALGLYRQKYCGCNEKKGG